MLSPLYAPLVSFGIALLVLVLLTRGKMARFALDKPNARSLHEKPVPRTGGIAILAGMLSGWSLIGPPANVITLGLIILIVVSFLDDLRGLSVPFRFGAHFVAAGTFAYFVLLPLVGGIGAFLLTLAIVWMINLYNFMDGSDGLAGGMALFGFGFYGVAAWIANDPYFSLFNLAIAMSAGAFLFFNFHPAKIFMGDAGAIPLGFLAATLGLLGWRMGDWPFWFPPLIFSPFIVDATATLLRRLFRGEKIWQAHREHYYQRLIQMGLGHRNLAVAEYVLMTAIGISSILAVRNPVPLFAFWGIAYAFIAYRVDRRWTESDK